MWHDKNKQPKQSVNSITVSFEKIQIFICQIVITFCSFQYIHNSNSLLRSLGSFWFSLSDTIKDTKKIICSCSPISDYMYIKIFVTLILKIIYWDQHQQYQYHMKLKHNNLSVQVFIQLFHAINGILSDLQKSLRFANGTASVMFLKISFAPSIFVSTNNFTLYSKDFKLWSFTISLLKFVASSLGWNYKLAVVSE